MREIRKESRPTDVERDSFIKAELTTCLSVQSGRKNGFFWGNKRIILGESAVVSLGLTLICNTPQNQQARP